jgi:hypothetical protein
MLNATWFIWNWIEFSNSSSPDVIQSFSEIYTIINLILSLLLWRFLLLKTMEKLTFLPIIKFIFISMGDRSSSTKADLTSFNLLVGFFALQKYLWMGIKSAETKFDLWFAQSLFLILIPILHKLNTGLWILVWFGRIITSHFSY